MSRSTIISREYLLLFSLIAFSILVRLFSLGSITILTLLIFFAFVGYHFYIYVSKAISEETKTKFTVEYTWGGITKPTDYFSFETIKNFLLRRDFEFYKQYISNNIQYIIFGSFIFIDILIAFKNLNLKNTGAYIALSLFTKFVFFAVYYLDKYFKKNESEVKLEEERILEIFNTQMTSFFSIFAVVFIIFFTLSRYLVEIFFGFNFVAYQSTLPFVLLANISLAIMFCIYLTASRLNKIVTDKLLKVYSIFFLVFFVFMNIGYIDLVAYFVLGMSTLFSILLYNFVIKKPDYILRTYNLLF
jgi:hypothetical protein